MKKCPKCGREYADANTLCPTDGTVLAKDGDELIGQVLASKYRVEELINEGGMGAVYRATHILMDKTVAIKVLHPALAADDKIVARFSREARAASRISHPHALNVTDFGESENGVVFLVMEYLRGRTLKEVLREDGPMPLARAVEIIKQVSGALDAAHAEGVVHRDLKSDNIMLMDVGDGDWAKVLDFGIAKIQEPVNGHDPALTAPNLIIGTPQYMSPEQCSQASEIDARSDIYSLGIILYEMLAGHVPFTGESPTAIMMKHLQEPPPSILEERSDLPAAVGRVVARALAKRPEDRFQSAAELLENLVLASGKAAPVAAEVATTGPAAPERSTNRIIVPTNPNEPARHTENSDHDEETVVHRRERPIAAAEIVATQTSPIHYEPVAESFNPWRIIVPAAAAILVAFVVIYALTRNSGQSSTNANQQTAPLASDPNSQPVQPAQPATGQGEQGITSTLPVPSPSASSGASLSGSTSSSTATAPSTVNQNQNNVETAAEPGNSNTNRSGNAKRGDNKNAAQDNNTEGEGDAQASPSSDQNNQPALVDTIKEKKDKPKESPSPANSPANNADDDNAPPPPKPKPSLPKPIKPKVDTEPAQAQPSQDNPDQ